MTTVLPQRLEASVFVRFQWDRISVQSVVDFFDSGINDNHFSEMENQIQWQVR